MKPFSDKEESKDPKTTTETKNKENTKLKKRQHIPIS